MYWPQSFAACAVLAAVSVSRCLVATTVSVSSTASHSIPTTLYGQMFESGDGGLYAELLQNRAFQQVTPDTSDALEPWEAVNGANITVIADSDPVSPALPNSLQFTVPSSASGSVGFSNEGYWGINVNASWTYNASLYYRFPSSSTFSGKLTLGLESSAGDVLASNSTTISGSQTIWKQIALELTPSYSASNNNNSFFVTVNGSEAAGETIHFAMFSLFPPTYKNRPNGMRVDIAETLADMKPAFFRFPGGNNLGQTWATRWQWNVTVGPLLDRPGRVGDWGYVNTDGLGLLEYLTFFEDVGMEPFMAVWAGYSLNGESLPEDDLSPYIQQAIEQIEFAVGDANTSSVAALRAQYGHPEPFNVSYVEIGNEDFFASDSYTYRWPAFIGNLSAAYPDINYIATTYPFDPIISPTPKQYDIHVYQTPGWFIENAFYYDDFERNGTRYFQGEYASISTNSSNLYGSASEGRFLYPTILSSTAEAAYMTGFERNADIVFAASYAPLLQLVNDSQWKTPDLITFDASTVVRSTSYYVQQLFSLNVGDEYLPSTLPTQNGTLYWSITRSSSTENVYIKLVNVASSEADVTFELPFEVASTGTLKLLTGNPDDSNTPDAPDYITPETSTIFTDSTLNYTAPAYSLSVIIVSTS
ncbi:glycoside hydrolase family 51 protein [Laetiporus sulphureus 93-53]|uniref:non-reducing end alpha-L-arabinofuranosidase n=1 Tax=Laetiporus sulphureus 93-53 TaxID=1314785 RepID=A0A165GL12_9APHY|nr:glycoside hydrolase family 51 protein [Laetiporus sulphureus 93-53]KZT10497.1 glycoside hydrolase family 51 protein [Laetiporus sulphureus 93-53]